MIIRFKDGKSRELEITTSSVEEVLKKLEINPMEVVVKRDDTIIIEEEILTNEDEITVIKVIFGG
ncbi:MAG: MoaD/ThiS family protein [Methanobacteriaceae archaeon]|nr:MoaD/ThiS family protein [Methanobacteriaceae archaeon]